MSSEMNTIAAAGPKQMAESPKPRKISNNTVAPKDQSKKMIAPNKVQQQPNAQSNSKNAPSQQQPKSTQPA